MRQQFNLLHGYITRLVRKLLSYSVWKLWSLFKFFLASDHTGRYSLYFNSVVLSTFVYGDQANISYHICILKYVVYSFAFEVALWTWYICFRSLMSIKLVSFFTVVISRIWDWPDESMIELFGRLLTFLRLFFGSNHSFTDQLLY